MRDSPLTQNPQFSFTCGFNITRLRALIEDAAAPTPTNNSFEFLVEPSSFSKTSVRHSCKGASKKCSAC